MHDRMERIGGSLIQHGPNSERVYLMKVAEPDCPEIVDKLENLAEREGYTKIFAKVPGRVCHLFLENGYRAEARVPQLYHGREEGVLLGKFLSLERKIEAEPQRVEEVLAAARDKARNKAVPVAIDPDFQIRPLTEKDVEAAAGVYREVFASYPFPIHDPAYLLETMRDHVRYFGAWAKGRLVALASAEMDRKAGNAEMTDFATLPEFRGHGLGQALLARMEEVVPHEGIRTAFTIARAYSFGMNITFARAGYRYAGTLRNNTQICGRQESMNVWHKPLA